MAKVDLSGLEELYKGDVPSTSAKAGGDDRELRALYAHIPQQQEESPSTSSDLVTAMQNKLGGPSVAALAQSIPNALMSMGHNIAPGMVGPSPTQANQALRDQGATGDLPVGSEFWKQAAAEESKREEDAAQRSPTATTIGHGLGDIAGFVAGNAALKGLTGGAKLLSEAPEAAGVLRKAATAGANEAATLAPVGVLQGALQSKAPFVGGTSEEKSQVMSDAAKSGLENAAVGGAFGAGGAMLKGGAEALAETKPGKYLSGLYNTGKEGIDLSKETTELGTLEDPMSLQNPVSMHSEQSANQLLDTIHQADQYLGKDVGKAIQEGTDRGIIVQAPELSAKINKIFELASGEVGAEAEEGAEEGQEAFTNKDFRNFFDVANKLKEEGLTPIELQEFRNDMARFARAIKMKDPIASNDAFNLTSDLTQQLRKQVPGYSTAAQRLDQFRKAIPETILSKDNPADITNLRYSGTRNVDNRLFNNIKSMIRGMYDPANMNAKASYSNLLKGLQDFNQSEMIRKAVTPGETGSIPETLFETMKMQPQDIESFLKQNAAKSKMLQDYAGTSALDMMHPIKATEKAAGYLANKAGVMVGGKSSAATNPVLQAGNKLYSASNEVLKDLSSKISGLPGGKEMSKALDTALDKGNLASKNAILFSIMQNPNYRNLVNTSIMGNLPK